MKKTFRTEIRRIFLTEGLPSPLKTADEHLQFFDNYLENTNLRLRTVRSPKNKEWQWILEKRTLVNSSDFTTWEVSEIYLDETEHALFEQFEGREISKNERLETNELRFNRYFYEYQNYQIEIDIFLNPLWGLNLAKVFFETVEEKKAFQKPDFLVFEVTENEFFIGKNLVGKTLADVRAEISRMNEGKSTGV